MEPDSSESWNTWAEAKARHDAGRIRAVEVRGSGRPQETLGAAPTPWDEVCRRTALGGTVEVRSPAR